jgi:23S rRNA (guanine2445-N2)-methyltransferase / 23S rRNA (guanine2069-N7)-methyltransferase
MDVDSALYNRLRKKYAHLQKWAAKNDLGAFRLYFHDLPEYAFALDLYYPEDALMPVLYIQEYQAPTIIDPEKVQRRRQLFQSSAQALFPDSHYFYKARLRQKLGQQYQKNETSLHPNAAFVVREQGLRFWVNLQSYLDTGLFLDHRFVRQRVRTMATGKKVLNLFAYTGSFSVYAACAGAQQVWTVDLSATYLAWAKRNFVLNQLMVKPECFIQTDVLQWLDSSSETFDLIIADVPTVSRSKRMREFWDVAADHPRFIARCMQNLNPGGVLLFSCNYRKFRLSEAIKNFYQVQDWTQATLPQDFQHSGAAIRQVFALRKIQ